MLNNNGPINSGKVNTMKTPDFKYMCNLENGFLFINFINYLHFIKIFTHASDKVIYLKLFNMAVKIQQRIPTDSFRDLLY